jgi:hypothetical protein
MTDTPPSSDFTMVTEALGRSIFDFGTPRPWWFAATFYLAHLVIQYLLCAILSALIVVIGRVIVSDAPFIVAHQIDRVVGCIYAVEIYMAIMSSRKAWGRPGYIFALIGTLILGALGGATLGLVPAAITLGAIPHTPKEELPPHA